MVSTSIFGITEQPDEASARLAAIVTNSDDAIISKNLDGIIQSWNQGAQRIFGYAAEEMIGQPLLKIIPPDRAHEEPDILNRLRRGERVDHFQTIRIRKDGRRVEVSVSISPIRDSTGKIIGASKIARDITESNRNQRERDRLYEMGKYMAGESDVHRLVQKITDVATELSNAQFGAFFYNVPDDKGGAYMLYTISGVAPEHFSKFPMSRNTDVFAPTFSGKGIVRSDDITKDPRYGQNAPHKGMPDGHLPVRSYLAVPVMMHDGMVIGGLFFGHSEVGIFDKHSEIVVASIAGNASIALENARLHRELTETAARFQQLANTIPQLAWMAKPDGSLFWLNQRWHDFAGQAGPDPMGMGWTSLLDPADLPRVLGTWKKSIADGVAWEDTFALRRHDGVLRWHLSRAMPQRDESGQILFWFGTNTDITDQRELMVEREELLAAERAARTEAERVGRMKDEFLATLSHELRTPLNAILGWSQLIRYGRDNQQTLEEGLAVIERNARAQSQLIEDLLDMSRIISGKLRLDVQRVDLAGVVNAAAEVLKPTAEAKGVQLRTMLDPLAGPVSGDPNRLQQVLWNLISNAIKFTPREGKVDVLLERVNSHLEITVSDTGQGIEPEFLPHVFERFRQSDSSTTRQHSGLGLGLAIVKQLVDLHGGRVRAKSAGQGKGSTFTVSLPLLAARHDDGERREHPAAPRSAHGTDEQTLSLGGIRVLVVDDERDSRELIARLLNDRHATTVTAESAEAGMEQVRTQRPDIILSDIGMPGTDGYQFMRQLRALPPEQGGKILAIALTAFARSEDRTRAMIAGYQFHLAKPVEPQELVATVASLVGRTS